MDPLQATFLSMGSQAVMKTGYISLESYCSQKPIFYTVYAIYVYSRSAQNNVAERVTLRLGEAGSVSSYSKAIQPNL